MTFTSPTSPSARPALFGIDRAIAYTLMSRAWSTLSTPLTLLFVARLLSPDEQGFYYTFGNVIGLQLFFELGLAYVVMQFASHEKSRLEWSDSGLLQGDETAKARLASVLRLALRWYGIVALLVVALIWPTGYWFFGHQAASVGVGWLLPWTWVVIVAASTLLLVPLYSLLEGSGKVAEIAGVRLWSSMCSALVLWGVLAAGGRLLAAPASTTVGLLVGASALLWRRRAFFFDLWNTGRHVAGTPDVVNWREEIWPFQWKLAVSWISGYFLFQVFNPALFAFHGAAEAGRMGMSIGLMSAVWATALSWVSTKAAPFGSLISQRDAKTLDALFFPAMWRSLAATIVGGIGFWGAVYALRTTGHPLSARLLDPWPLGLLVTAMVGNQLLVSQAIYLRAHKEEPFLWLSIVSAMVAATSTFVLGRPYGATGMMAGYLVVTLCSLVAGTVIFRRKRHEWHREWHLEADQRGASDSEPDRL